ncbi:hypothetical protein [Streptomyces sp. NPDC046978]|uniref:hypothetical protein n=1 Tax=Streptomyces sp. NPDC046978 TaxID=3154704 RepID=UPI0033E757C4
MRWWVKARRAYVVLPLSLACFLILSAVVQDTSVMLPSITGNKQVTLSLFVPVPLLCGLMMCLESRLPAPEVSSTRVVPLMDAALVFAVLGTGLMCSILGSLFLDMPLAGATGRNACFLGGIMLLGRAIMGQPAVMLPVAWVVLVTFVGFRGPGDPYPWALVPEPGSDAIAATVATLAFLIGTLANLRSSRKLS